MSYRNHIESFAGQSEISASAKWRRTPRPGTPKSGFRPSCFQNFRIWAFWASAYPSRIGGAGMDTLAYAICVEECARFDGALALTVASHNGLGVAHIQSVGTEDQKRKYLTRAASGRMAGCLGADGAWDGLGCRCDSDVGQARGGALGHQRHQDIHHSGVCRRLLRPFGAYQRRWSAALRNHCIYRGPGDTRFYSKSNVGKVWVSRQRYGRAALRELPCPGQQSLGRGRRRLLRYDENPRQGADIDCSHGAWTWDAEPWISPSVTPTSERHSAKPLRNIRRYDSWWQTRGPSSTRLS